MIRQSSAKIKKNGVDTLRFSNLVKTLRKERGLLQAALAHELGVSRPLVVAWETRRQWPSVENILQLAGLTSKKEDRLWLLTEAGVDIGMVSSDLRQDAAERMKTLDEVRRGDRDSLTAVPIVEIAELAGNSAVDSRSEEGREVIHFSARHLANAGDVVAFGVPRTDKLFFPFWLKPNDLILIDRGLRSLRDFFIEEHHRCLHLAALLIPHKDLFFHDMVGSVDLGGGETARLRAEERRYVIAKQTGVPVLIVGHFEEEIAGAETKRVPNESDLCRLVFVYGSGGRLVLTDWAHGSRPRDMGLSVNLLHDARIVGSVSGWVSSPRAVGLKEQMAESVRLHGKPLPPGKSLISRTGQ